MLSDLEKIFSQNAGSPVFIVLAHLYYNKRLYRNAAQVCEIGLKHDPDNSDGQYMLAKLLLVKGDIVYAEKILKTLIVKESQNLNVLLLLLAVMEKLNRNFNSMLSYIKKAMLLYPENRLLELYYNKYCVNSTAPSKYKKNHRKGVKQNNFLNSLQINNPFVLNPKLATKTLYQLFYSQHKYSDAYHVLLVMQKNKQNKNFVIKELKKIQIKLLKE
ncbi:MAG: hypothetical protein CMG66_01635 [Candidatus Marinimicrobia bacterium]|nr:hypothetical protein [Candidatus Neomarinimicrobiota bacterium]|tara:strand:+ start:31187 stop:31834 length:648 start_codon:yes stop_codon:yes gene_type:complete